MKPRPTVSFVGVAAEAGDADDAAPDGDADAPGPEAPATMARAASSASRAVFSGRDGRFTGPPIRASADAHETALEDDDDEVQTDPQERDRQEGGEHQRDVEQAAAGEDDEEPEPTVGARPFGDDGPDDGEGHPDAQSAEDRRERARHLDEQQALGACRAEGPAHLEEVPVDLA